MLEAGVRIYLSNVGARIETEASICRSAADSLHRRQYVDSPMATLNVWWSAYLGNSGDVSVELASHETVVGEDEGPVWVEANGDDILGILAGKVLILLDSAVVLADEVLLICPGQWR
jgi:hypothetical protein